MKGDELFRQSLRWDLAYVTKTVEVTAYSIPWDTHPPIKNEFLVVEHFTPTGKEGGWVSAEPEVLESGLLPYTRSGCGRLLDEVTAVFNREMCSSRFVVIMAPLKMVWPLLSKSISEWPNECPDFLWNDYLRVTLKGSEATVEWVKKRTFLEWLGRQDGLAQTIHDLLLEELELTSNSDVREIATELRLYERGGEDEDEEAF